MHDPFHRDNSRDAAEDDYCLQLRFKPEKGEQAERVTYLTESESLLAGRLLPDARARRQRWALLLGMRTKLTAHAKGRALLL